MALDVPSAPPQPSTAVLVRPPRSPDEPAEKGALPRRHGARERRAWERAIGAAIPVVLVVNALMIWLVLTAEAGTNPVGFQMPAMDLQHRVAYWWPFLMGDALGVAALIWSYLAVLAGLAFTTRSPRWLPLGRRRINDLHRQLSLTTLVLIAGHVLFVAVGSMNNAMTARVVDVGSALIPFDTTWNRWPYAFGIVAFYLSLVLGPTYYLRHRLGARAWKVAHRMTLVVYVLGVVHTMEFDHFSYDGPYRLGLWVAQIPLAALLAYRIASPANRRASPRRWKAAARVASAIGATVVLAGLLVVVSTGRIGGAASPFPSSTAHHHPTTPSPSRPLKMNMPGM